MNHRQCNAVEMMDQYKNNTSTNLPGAVGSAAGVAAGIAVGFAVGIAEGVAAGVVAVEVAGEGCRSAVSAELDCFFFWLQSGPRI